eukprot:1799668-Prymnesium_polylepis.1
MHAQHADSAHEVTLKTHQSVRRRSIDRAGAHARRGAPRRAKSTCIRKLTAEPMAFGTMSCRVRVVGSITFPPSWRMLPKSNISAKIAKRREPSHARVETCLMSERPTRNVSPIRCSDRPNDDLSPACSTF